MAGPQPYRQKGGGAEVPCQLGRRLPTENTSPITTRATLVGHITTTILLVRHIGALGSANMCRGNDATRKRSVVHQPYRIASRTTGTCDCGPARAGPQPGASTYGHTCSAPLLCLVQVQVLAIIVPRSTTSWEAILTPLWWSIAPNRPKSPVFAPAALRGTRFGLESRAVGRKFFAKSGTGTRK